MSRFFFFFECIGLGATSNPLYGIPLMDLLALSGFFLNDSLIMKMALKDPLDISKLL